MQTAVEFFFKELKLWYGSTEKLDLLYEQAKEMEKKQIIDAANLKKEDRWFDAKLYNNCGEKYYAETYGSKGSDETKGGELATFNTSSQTEISDDCIKCDYCSKVVKKFMAIDVWMITDNNKNVCYECQIKNHIGYGEQKGILVELMELDSKDGLYESVTISSPQYIPEISDEEIEKWVESTPYYGHCTPEYKEGLDEGAKWYREQLKKKQ